MFYNHWLQYIICNKKKASRRDIIKFKMDNKKSEILVIIPAYNEEKSIGKVIKEVKESAPKVDIVVIDDGSIDNTAEVARRCGVKVISHPINLGYGTSLQTGYKYTLRFPYKIVVQLDADGQHPSTYIHNLVNALKSNSADVVIGSRFLENRKYNGPWIRKLGMRIFSVITSLIAKERITDTSSGFRALKREVVDFFSHIDYPSDFDDADLIILTHFAGFRIKEISVAMNERESGKSAIAGTKLIYYGFKMLLSIAVTLLREKPHKKGRK